MMLLTTRLRVDPNGKPHIPGSLEVWRNLFLNHPQGKYDGKLTKPAANWKEPDDVLEALFALCRKAVENEPLKIFMADRAISTAIAPRRSRAATVDRLARDYRTLRQPVPALQRIAQPLRQVHRSVPGHRRGHQQDHGSAAPRPTSPAPSRRWSASGRSSCRQQSIPEAQADAAFSGIVGGFAQVTATANCSMPAATASSCCSAPTAGDSERPGANARPAGRRRHSADSETHEHMVQDMIRILEAQRIVSLDTLFQLADHSKPSKGEKLDSRPGQHARQPASPKSSCRARRSPRTKRTPWASATGPIATSMRERKLNLRAAIEKAAGDAEKVKDIRGLLAPLLRDTLLAFNYAHYAPPGRADPLHQSALRAQPRFPRRAGRDHTWRATETYRHRLALQRRRPPGRLALRPALRAGRSRTELPHPHRRPRRSSGATSCRR